MREPSPSRIASSNSIYSRPNESVSLAYSSTVSVTVRLALLEVGELALGVLISTNFRTTCFNASTVRLRRWRGSRSDESSVKMVQLGLSPSDDISNSCITTARMCPLITVMKKSSQAFTSCDGSFRTFLLFNRFLS